jgi:hypothetical protein
MEGGVSSREELLSREPVRRGSSDFCRNGLKSRFAKYLEDALVRKAPSVTVAFEDVGDIAMWAREGEGGDETQGRAGYARDEDGPETLTVGSFFGVTTLSPKRREEEGDACGFWGLGWEMPLGSSSSKTESNGSSSPPSVTRTARRGSGRGAKRIRRPRKLLYSGAELRLERRRWSSSEVYWRVREFMREEGGVG